MSSTLRWEAASNSNTSSAELLMIPRQISHSRQGSGVGPLSQFRAIASTSAVLVFPVPRGPQNR